MEEGRQFPAGWMWELYQQWQAWRRGIPLVATLPAYGDQNPNLLDAFAVLDMTAVQVERKREYDREKRQLELIQALLSR